MISTHPRGSLLSYRVPSRLPTNPRKAESRLCCLPGTVFLTLTGSGNEKERVLVHAMSNTGAIFNASTIIVYQRRHGTDKLFPHQLLVLDSTPGSLGFRSQASR